MYIVYTRVGTDSNWFNWLTVKLNFIRQPDCLIMYLYYTTYFLAPFKIHSWIEETAFICEIILFDCQVYFLIWYWRIFCTFDNFCLAGLLVFFLITLWSLQWGIKGIIYQFAETFIYNITVIYQYHCTTHFHEK